LNPNLDVCMTASLTCPRHKYACVMSSSSRLDRRADLAGRPSYDVHPTISMTPGGLVREFKIAKGRRILIKNRLATGAPRHLSFSSWANLFFKTKSTTHCHGPRLQLYDNSNKNKIPLLEKLFKKRPWTE
jgi:hypothetical protein